MANLKIKKADLKGPIQVGHGWLVATAWAVRAGTDKRLVDKQCMDAGFAGLDVVDLPKSMATYLDKHAVDPIMDEGYLRTNVLLEGEDGKLTRVYKTATNGGGGSRFHCFNEDFIRILGAPARLVRTGTLFTCGSGIIAPTTDTPPPWALEVN